MEVIGVGFVGCGEMARIHATILSELPNVEIVGAHCSQKAMLNQFVHKFGGNAYPSEKSLINDPRTRAIYILNRSNAHAEPAIEAVKRGKAVFCEKPMTLSLDDARRVVEAVDNNQSLFMVGYNLRYIEPIRKLRRSLEKRACNEKLVMTVSLEYGPFLDGWIGDPMQGGGLLHAIGSHAFDLIRYVTGNEIVDIFALTTRIRKSTTSVFDDTCGTLLRMDDGSLITLQFNDCALPDFAYTRGQHMIQITAHTSKVSYKVHGFKCFEKWKKGRNTRTEYAPYNRVDSWGYAAENFAFIKALKGNYSGVLPNHQDGIRSLQVIKSAEKAIRKGVKVNIDYF